MVISDGGKLLLLYVPKTSCYFHYIFLKNHHSSNTESQDQEIWMGGTENYTLRYDISGSIKHCLYGQIWGTRLNEQYYEENNEYRNNG